MPRQSQLRSAALLAGLTALGAWALPPPMALQAVAAARELLGRPYQLGGRLRGGEGIDCQGLVFYAMERIGRCGWKSFSVFPTESVKKGELGSPVEGLFPVALEALDPARLEPGDVVMLLHATENSKEPALTTLNGTPVWVWHVGLATGGGQWINADPFSGQVVEGDLLAYLRQYTYAGIAVTRMPQGPSPQRCRPEPRLPRSRSAER